MRRIKVQFEVEVPIAISDEIITEWLKFETHIASIKVTNPLADRDLIARPGTLRWEDL